MSATKHKASYRMLGSPRRPTDNTKMQLTCKAYDSKPSSMLHGGSQVYLVLSL